MNMFREISIKIAVISLLALNFYQNKAVETTTCSMQSINGVGTIALNNDGKHTSWVRVDNSQNYPVKLVNAENSRAEFILNFFPGNARRQVVRWNGDKKILCYKPEKFDDLTIPYNQLKWIPVDCSSVVQIDECYSGSGILETKHDALMLN